MTAVRRVDPDRKDRIVDAALDVIAEHGVAGATHRTIAAAADVPLGSMTYHFENLDEVLPRITAGMRMRIENKREAAHAHKAANPRQSYSRPKRPTNARN